MSEKEDMVNEMMSRIDLLATKLGVAAEHLWEVMVRQAVITGTIELLTVIFITSGLAIYVKLLLKNRWYDKIEEVPTLSGVIVVCSMVIATVFGLCMLVAFTTLDSAITKILNPEYWAYQSFLGNVR